MEEERAKSAVAWRWVIEALASSDLVDLPLLYELLSGEHLGGEYLGTAAMEATALRCLEALSEYVQQQEQEQEEEDEHVSGVSNNGFKTSDTSQHVLHSILRQSFNSSIQTFVNHKKATTNASCTLELLKNLILQGNTPFLNQITQTHSHPPTSLNNPHSLLHQPDTDAQLPNENAPNNYTDNLGPPAKKLKLQHQHSVSFHDPQNNKPTNQTPAAGDSSENNVATSNNPDTNNPAPNKPIFSSSQCVFSTQDSLTLTDDTEPNLCMKCNEGGQLLACHATTCPLLFHHTCLGCAVSFDDQGNFYCPICAYSRAVSEYVRAKQKVSLARKDLTFFIGGGV